MERSVPGRVVDDLEHGFEHLFGAGDEPPRERLAFQVLLLGPVWKTTCAVDGESDSTAQPRKRRKHVLEAQHRFAQLKRKEH